MATLTIDMSDRHTFDQLWREWTDKKAKRANAPVGLTIIIDPVQQGPDERGRLTLLEVPEEFLEELRANGFRFKLG